MEKAGASFFYHADGLGSITEITDSVGVVKQRYTYSSFGRIESQLDPNFIQPYTFTGREFDPETGLYYYRARYYEHANGRFMQEDSLGFVTGPNFYTYASGNPIIFTDPLGLYSLSEFANDVDAVLNSIPAIAAFSALDIGAGVVEAAAGAALVAGGGAATVGSAGAAAPVTIPTLVLGTAAFEFGTLTIFEASVHLQGAIIGNKAMMEFDALGSVGRAKGTVDLLRDLRRPFSGGVRNTLLRATNLLRFLDQVYRDFKCPAQCPVGSPPK